MSRSEQGEAGPLYHETDGRLATAVTAQTAALRLCLPMRLLCADDEEDIRTILELALGLDPELEVELVDSGTAALARAAAGGYDAIVLDAMMPGLDGYETCRRLKAEPATASIPVVFLTAKTQRGEVERALALGAVACLMKPFDPMTLARELRTALGR
jgi:CheY-like chemotaxis protein